MKVNPHMTGDELLKASSECPRIMLRFATAEAALAIIEDLSFIQPTESPEGRKLFPPEGVVVHRFRGKEGTDLLVVGDLTPSWMLETAEKGFSRGAYISAAGFVGADTPEWIPTFDRVMALCKKGPKGSACALLIPKALQTGASKTPVAPTAPASPIGTPTASQSSFDGSARRKAQTPSSPAIKKPWWQLW